MASAVQLAPHAARSSMSTRTICGPSARHGSDALDDPRACNKPAGETQRRFLRGGGGGAPIPDVSHAGAAGGAAGQRGSGAAGQRGRCFLAGTASGSPARRAPPRLDLSQRDMGWHEV